MHYLVLFGVVLLAGLAPAFGPPSWIFAVFFYHKYRLAAILVILLTATATTMGRLLLALITRWLKPHIPPKYVANLEYSEQLLAARQKSTWVVLGLFVLSPLPSAQLFEAAGLIGLPLIRLGLAFFAGRLVTLSLYLALAHLTLTNLDRLWETGFTSAWAVIFEILSILGLIALFNLRWLLSKLKLR